MAVPLALADPPSSALAGPPLVATQTQGGGGSASRLGKSSVPCSASYATTFIWAAVIAALRCSDAIQPLHVAGMVLLLGGIVCMSW